MDIRFLSTPSARRATCYRLRYRRTLPISIHALREEGDALTQRLGELASQFLSTPSVRRATKRQNIGTHTARFLSTPSARRATQSFSTVLWFQPISIHALREEGDYADICTAARAEVFLSTPSARRATPRLRRRPRPCWHFYPRPPRGGRLYRGCCLSDVVRISIHALREEGDGCQPAPGHSVRRISIHALREEGDLSYG